jgi:hypothetical protein
MSRPLPSRSAFPAPSRTSAAIPPPAEPELAPSERPPSKDVLLGLLTEHILRGQVPSAPLVPPVLAIADDGRGVYSFPEGPLPPPTNFLELGPRG